MPHAGAMTRHAELTPDRRRNEVSPDAAYAATGPAAWWARNRTAVTEALVVFLGARVVLSLIATLAVALLPEQTGQHDVFHRSATVWLDVWARWDSEYYLDVAQHGYSTRPGLLNMFPLYPLLIAGFAVLLGHDYVLAGVVVSSLATFIALVYLFKLTAWELGEEAASRAVLYMAVYPAALFLLAVYTESLFLAVTVATFYYARRGRWAMAGLAAFLAGLTRPNGVVLLVPLAYEVWRQAEGSPRRLNVSHGIAAAATPLALALWALYLAWSGYDPLEALVFSRAQPPFERVASMPWVTLAAAMQHLGSSGLSPLARAVNTTDYLAAVALIQASVVAWWRLPRAYAIYLTTSTLLALSSTVPNWPLQSMLRYSLSAFPVFFLLAQLGANSHWNRLILIVSAPLLGMYTALFATWYWVF